MTNVVDRILTELYGNAKPYECRLLTDGNYKFSYFFEKPLLSRACGENWKLISKTHDYEERIVNNRKDL